MIGINRIRRIAGKGLMPYIWMALAIVFFLYTFIRNKRKSFALDLSFVPDCHMHRAFDTFFREKAGKETCDLGCYNFRYCFAHHIHALYAFFY